jgi:hypothetical protein
MSAAARAADLLPVVPITAALAGSFPACLDTVAREKRFLAQVEAPPLERVQQFVADGLEKDAVQFVELDGERVVGWADIRIDGTYFDTLLMARLADSEPTSFG